MEQLPRGLNKPTEQFLVKNMKDFGPNHHN